MLVNYFVMSVLAHCLNMHKGYSVGKNEALVMIVLEIFFHKV